MKWIRRHENVTKIESIEEIYDLNKKNHIVILPQSAKMKDAIEIYSKKIISMRNFCIGITMVFLMDSLTMTKICIF